MSEYRKSSRRNENSDLDISTLEEQEFVLEVDKTKVFWLSMVGLLSIGCIFVFGYWIGHRDNSDELSDASPVSLEESDEPVMSEDFILSSIDGENTSSTPVDLESPANSIDVSTNSIGQAVENPEFEDTGDITITQKKTVEPRVSSTPSPSYPQRKRDPNIFYDVQIASLSSSDASEKLKQQLIRKGFYKTYVDERNGNYVIKTGHYLDYDYAIKIRDKIHNSTSFHDAFVLKNRRVPKKYKPKTTPQVPAQNQSLTRSVDTKQRDFVNLDPKEELLKGVPKPGTWGEPTSQPPTTSDQNYQNYQNYPPVNNPNTNQIAPQAPMDQELPTSEKRFENQDNIMDSPALEEEVIEPKLIPKSTPKPSGTDEDKPDLQKNPDSNFNVNPMTLGEVEPSKPSPQASQSQAKETDINPLTLNWE